MSGDTEEAFFDEADALFDLGVTLFTVGVNGPDYDLAKAEALCGGVTADNPMEAEAA